MKRHAWGIGDERRAARPGLFAILLYPLASAPFPGVFMLTRARSYPAASAVLELLKPITWFPPMWAFACGVVASGVSIGERWPTALVGVLLAGPLVCAMSQAVNDWYDRDYYRYSPAENPPGPERGSPMPDGNAYRGMRGGNWYDRDVDAINEPDRPIPSGRIPGKWGYYIAVAWTILSLLVAAALGRWVLIAALVGVALAWAYSAPPPRLKRNGWWGNAACGFSYEGLAWITGGAVMLGGALPAASSIVLALLYSLGAHGIMTLNDFKSIRGDSQMGVDSLPVLLGPDGAAKVACGVMAAPQVVVIALLIGWGRPVQAGVVGLLLLGQFAMMKRFLKAPVEQALWYSGFGVPLYVLGMMAAAFAIRTL